MTSRSRRSAAFGFLTARHGNRFGILVAGGDRVTRLGPTTDAFRAARVAVAAVRLRRGATRRPTPASTVSGALLSLERTRPRRGQIVVISDFLDDHELGERRCAASR